MSWKKIALLVVGLLAVLFGVLAALMDGGEPARVVEGVGPNRTRTGVRASGNVVVLVVDTLRADHLGCYGYRRRTSPRIDALAASGTRYLRAYAASPWTLPSHAALFTGLYSFEHGAHTYLVENGDADERDIPAGKRGKPKWSADEYKLEGRHLTLAEFLSRNGFATGAVVANAGYLSKRWNLHQGFGFYKVKPGNAGRVNEVVFDWLDKVKHRQFFLFVNYMDTHRVYNTSPRPGLLSGSVVRDKGQLLNKLIYRVMDPANANRPIPTDVVGKVIDQYDTAVANVDEGIGELVRYLKRNRLYDDTMIIVTSDHGEFFGEHRLVEHSKDVYQEVLHVPMVLKDIGQTLGKRSSVTISSVDLPGMVVRGLGKALAVRGKKVFKRIPGHHSVISENYYSRAKDVSHPLWGQRFMRIRAALYDYPYKYILSSDGQDEMYNIKIDKAETRNLIPEAPDRARRYRARVSRHVDATWKQHRPPLRMVLSDSEKAQLKALGYID